MRKILEILITCSIIFIFSSFLNCSPTNPFSNSADSSYVLNTLGSSEYISDYWNPHSYNLKNAEWSISFGDKVTMFLNNNASEFGHIACGSWWVPNFLYAAKLPLKNVKALVVSVDLYLSDVSYNTDNGLLRMAVASAINNSGAVEYTELDFWDSPALFTLLYSNSSKYYNGTDEYSYKINQIRVGQWIKIEIDFIPYIKESWGDLSQGYLESIYIVIESDCREHISVDVVSLDVRNLIIRVTE
jgi:hypothetical protein